MGGVVTILVFVVVGLVGAGTYLWFTSGGPIVGSIDEWSALERKLQVEDTSQSIDGRYHT